MRMPTLSGGLARTAAIAAVLLLGLTTSPASAADNGPDAKREKGGVALRLPQSPPMTPIDIGYLREDVAGPRPASRLDVEPDNAGIAGAEMGIKENNAGGRFMGNLYGLDVETASSAEEAIDALKTLYESGHNYIVVDASAPTLLKLSDWAKDKDILLFNIRAEDVSLRQEDCRANIMHVVPDRYMLADALAQYLVKMGWTDWLLIHGSTDADIAYRDAVTRAAKRFGGNIVDVREYIDVSGGRRDSVGPIPPAKPHKEANASNNVVGPADYDVIMVADENQLFAPLMPYRGGGQPRIVAGTTGLTATTWSPGHEKWGATQANNNFEKANKRLMLPIDHMAYVATRTIGEAVTRKPKNEFDTVSDFIHGPDLQLAPFKGIKQQFRPWDGQFRQPILIATEKVPVSVSPQKGFPHASHPEIEVDTLGIDEPESTCKM